MICSRCSTKIPDEALVCKVCGAHRDGSAPDRFIGQRLLDQYVVRQKLGQGGFGSVYEGEQPAFRRKVAIKTLHQNLTQEEKIVKRFFREGLAASALEHHPAAVKMLSLGSTDDGTLFIVMEFLEGETLSAHLQKRGPLSPEECVELLAPAFSLLKEAHEKGIIHRDLKPENIMLARIGESIQLKVLDFGIAGILESDENITATGAVSGTPPYMPPEQWRGLKHTNTRSDIYSLAVIVYRCVSGEYPFIAESAPEWMMKHTTERPRDLTSVCKRPISEGFHMAVMKALAKAPEDRFNSVEEFEQALLRGLSGPRRVAPPKETTQPRTNQLANTVPLPKDLEPASQARWITLGALGLILLVYFSFAFMNKDPNQTKPQPSKNQEELPPQSVPLSAPIIPSTQESKPQSQAASSTKAPVKAPKTKPIYKLGDVYVSLGRFSDDGTADLGAVFESYVKKEVTRQGKQVGSLPSSTKLLILDGRVVEAKVQSKGGKFVIAITTKIIISRDGAVLAFFEKNASAEMEGGMSLKEIQEVGGPLLETLTAEIFADLLKTLPEWR